MRLSAQELAEIEAMTAAGILPPPAPPLPGLAVPTLDALIRHRRARLAR